MIMSYRVKTVSQFCHFWVNQIIKDNNEDTSKLLKYSIVISHSGQFETR